MSSKLVILRLKGETDAKRMMIGIVSHDRKKQDLIKEFHEKHQQSLEDNPHEIRLIQYGEVSVADPGLDTINCVIEATLAMASDPGSLPQSFVETYAKALHEGVLEEGTLSRFRPEVKSFMQMCLAELVS